MEVSAQDVVDVVANQRNEALNALAMALAQIKALERELASMKTPDSKVE